jgi:hypothetical protein
VLLKLEDLDVAQLPVYVPVELVLAFVAVHD